MSANKGKAAAEAAAVPMTKNGHHETYNNYSTEGKKMKEVNEKKHGKRVGTARLVLADPENRPIGFRFYMLKGPADFEANNFWVYNFDEENNRLEIGYGTMAGKTMKVQRNGAQKNRTVGRFQAVNIKVREAIEKYSLDHKELPLYRCKEKKCCYVILGQNDAPKLQEQQEEPEEKQLAFDGIEDLPPVLIPGDYPVAAVLRVLKSTAYAMINAIEALER